jgi:hypothetical protein
MVLSLRLVYREASTPADLKDANTLLEELST